MAQLTFGRDSQVSFQSEMELTEAVEYILASPHVKIVFEENDKSGAWAPEYRVLFYDLASIPGCLRRQLTAGVGNVVGRINCEEFVKYIQKVKSIP